LSESPPLTKLRTRKSD